MLVVVDRRFGTGYRSHPQGSNGPKRMPGKRWVRYYVGDGVDCDVSQGSKLANQITIA
jgi:hypothetical protein